MQSKRDSHYEVMTNQVIGICGGWLIVFLLFPLFDHFDQSIVATISSVIFFIWSYLRSYIIRRIFNSRHLSTKADEIGQDLQSEKHTTFSEIDLKASK